MNNFDLPLLVNLMTLGALAKHVCGKSVVSWSGVMRFTSSGRSKLFIWRLHHRYEICARDLGGEKYRM
jgi:hypothetical protein